MVSFQPVVNRRAFIGGAAAFGVACVAVPSLAFADPVSSEKEELTSQIIAMQDEVSRSASDYNTALDDYDSATAAMEDAQKRADEAQSRIGALQTRLGSRARTMYRTGSSSFLDLLLGATTFEEFATNWDLLVSMSRDDAQLVSETKDVKAELEEARATYESQRDTAARKLQEASDIREAGEATVAELQARLDSLDDQTRAQVVEQYQLSRSFQAEQEAQQLARHGEYSTMPGSSSSSAPSAPAEAPSASDPSPAPAPSPEPAPAPAPEPEPNYGSPIPACSSALEYAASRIGCPYVYGGSGPDVFDCSGLTSWSYNQVGRWIGRSDSSQYASADAILPVSSAEPGDVLWTSGHVGMAAVSGGGTYIHAPQPGETVCYASWPQFSAALRFAV